MHLRSCQYLLRQVGHFHVTCRLRRDWDRLYECHCHRCYCHPSDAPSHGALGAPPVARTEPRIGTSVVIVGHGVDELAAIESLCLCLCLCLCRCLCRCQTNLHMRVARQTPPNRQKLQSQASDRRKQNACLSAVHSEVGWGQQLHAKSFLVVAASSDLLEVSALATNTQCLEKKDGGKSVRYATSHIGRSPSCSEQT